MKAPAFVAPLLGPNAGSCVLVDLRGRVIATKVRGAFDAKTRKKGLLGRNGLEDNEALVIAPCNAVHTFFMKFPIDVVHLGREGRVLRVKPALRPWRMDICVKAFAVVELPAGTIGRLQIQKGDSLSVAVVPRRA